MAFATFAGAASPSLVDLDANFGKAAEKSSGTFTPTVAGQTSAGAGTYTVRLGAWRRNGDMMHVSLRLTWSGHTGTGTLTITGFPVAAVFAHNSATVGYQQGFAAAVTGFMANSNVLELYAVAGTPQAVVASGSIALQISYPVA